MTKKEPFPEVEPHGDLKEIIKDVWYLTGTVPFKPLIRLSRNMVVIRHDNELTLINSVRLNAAGQKALDELGKVTHILKIGMHGMDDNYYLDRYGAKYWSSQHTESEYGDVHPLVEGTKLPFPDSILFEFKDTIISEAAVIIDRDGGLLITCDSIQHWVANDLMSGGAKLLTRLFGFQKSAQIGPPWKKIQTPPNESLRADFDRLASHSFDRIIGGHGGLLESSGVDALKATIEREFSD